MISEVADHSARVGVMKCACGHQVTVHSPQSCQLVMRGLDPRISPARLRVQEITGSSPVVTNLWTRPSLLLRKEPFRRVDEAQLQGLDHRRRLVRDPGHLTVRRFNFDHDRNAPAQFAPRALGLLMQGL